jgi:hypothetical protein
MRALPAAEMPPFFRRAPPGGLPGPEETPASRAIFFSSLEIAMRILARRRTSGAAFSSRFTVSRLNSRAIHFHVTLITEIFFQISYLTEKTISRMAPDSQRWGKYSRIP